MKNKASSLPDEFCELEKLETFEFSSNQLRWFFRSDSVPRRDSGGRYHQKITVSTGHHECAHKLQMMSLRLTRNQLASLPSSFQNDGPAGKHPAPSNEVQRFPCSPHELAPDLLTFPCCKNSIFVPQPIWTDGLAIVKNLWLDWNSIQELPTEVSKRIHTSCIRSVWNAKSSALPHNGHYQLKGQEGTRRVVQTELGVQHDRKPVQVIKSLQALSSHHH